uniref:Uncharacterized protein n=1 Tax=Arundo donax TaxID=35708 RepID=A0A0A8XUX3_ARUDO
MDTSSIYYTQNNCSMDLTFLTSSSGRIGKEKQKADLECFQHKRSSLLSSQFGPSKLYQ